jgi:DNA topoisomerase-1
VKTLLIVESPSKGKTIQKYLGKDFIVMASKGHITELAKTGKHNLGIDIDRNFKPHYILMEDKVTTLDELLDAAKKVDQVMIASDPDREGEAISWHLNQRLDGIQKPIKRVVFHEIKKKAILKALTEAREIDENLFHSQEARRILDRIVGFMASPFLMNFFGQNLSAGRVQSVVTKMITDREREIEAFIPEEFWTIQVSLTKDKNSGFLTKFSGKLTDLDLAEDMRDRLMVNEYTVSDLISSEEKKAPMPPLVTSSLQRLMSRLHGFEADQTMSAAQALYEAGHCTYIRTDSVRVSDEALEEVRKWIGEHGYTLPKKPNTYKNKDAAQDAHECIRPTDLSNEAKDIYFSSEEERLVYETIWKTFIASQMTPAIYNTLKITAHVKNDPSAEVKASGKALKSPGFMEILGIVDDSKIEIPNLVKGDDLFLFGKNPVRMEKKKTQPPPRFNLDELLKDLEHKKIGRPSTFAELVSKITARNYVEKKGNVFYPTELGKKITDILTQYFTFMDYNYSANLEELLDDIAAGKINHIDMLKKFYPEFKLELDRAYLGHGGTLCDKCGSPMVVKTAKTTGDKFLACTAYPSCRNTKPYENI